MALSISPLDLLKQMDSATPLRVLDVRSAAEFATGHVPGAMNIPMEQIDGRMADVPAPPLVITCESGKRAEIVASWLGDQSQVTLLDGGTRAWRVAGYPLVSCAANRWTLDRQVRLIAGILVLTGTLLAVLVNAKWVYAAMLIGAGLTFAGATNICGMAMILAKMPWNAARKTEARAGDSLGVNCRS